MRFRDFVRYHRSYLAFFTIIIVALVALNGFLLYKRERYALERERLRAAMSDVEREKTDLALAQEQSRLQMMIALIRRQARLDPAIHLAVALDSARMYLGREGAVLREAPVEVGPERRIGIVPDTVHMATPRGERTVQRVLGKDDGWEVPEWVYADRALPIPAERTVKGALGPVAILLNGGTVIYALPSAGPLNDSSYVLPGSIRARAEDLRAIAPNVKPGMSVYFY